MVILATLIIVVQVVFLVKLRLLIMEIKIIALIYGILQDMKDIEVYINFF